VPQHRCDDFGNRRVFGDSFSAGFGDLVFFKLMCVFCRLFRLFLFRLQDLFEFAKRLAHFARETFVLREKVVKIGVGNKNILYGMPTFAEIKVSASRASSCQGR
jgi:hypothetical protein